MLIEAQHPCARSGASARIASLVSVALACAMALLSFLAPRASADGLQGVTQAAAPVTKAAGDAVGSIGRAAATVTHAANAPVGLPKGPGGGGIAGSAASRAAGSVGSAAATLIHAASAPVGSPKGPGGGLTSPV